MAIDQLPINAFVYLGKYYEKIIFLSSGKSENKKFLPRTIRRKEEIYHEPHEQGANLESGEIYYKYTHSRKRGIKGFSPKTRGKLYDKITDRNPLNLHSV
jgi:hypothetical protein